MIPLISEIAEFRYILDPNGFARTHLAKIKRLMLRTEAFVVSQDDHSAIMDLFRQIAVQAVFLNLPSAKRVVIWTAINLSFTRNWTIIADQIHQLTGLDLFQLPRSPALGQSRHRFPKRRRR